VIRTLPATTGPQEVHDTLASMTDGDTCVVAREVMDHPEAVWVANRQNFGGDGGPGLLGVWILGRPEDVLAHLDRHGWVEHEEQYAVGMDPDQTD